MPKSLSTLKSESRVINMEGCKVGTCAWKLMFSRVIFCDFFQNDRKIVIIDFHRRREGGCCFFNAGLFDMSCRTPSLSGERYVWKVRGLVE